MSAMKSLILTGWLIPEFTKPDFADLAVDFFFRFVDPPMALESGADEAIAQA
jgi:hypothetical protein